MGPHLDASKQLAPNGKYSFSDLVGVASVCVTAIGVGSLVAGLSIDAGVWYLWLGALLGGVLMLAGCAFLVLLIHYRKWFRPPFAKP